jgi:alpha-glucoside transport system permease protein
VTDHVLEPWTTRLQPFVFAAPVIPMLLWSLALRACRSLYLGLFGRNGPSSLELMSLLTAPREYAAAFSARYVGFGNYIAVFTDRLIPEAPRNNILFWPEAATPLAVIARLLIGLLADRIRSGRAANSAIDMPDAVSNVGASVFLPLLTRSLLHAPNGSDRSMRSS